MKILDKYQNINDLKKMNLKQLNALAIELREYLINLAKQKEIHLSSNLGIVELTISSLLEFDLLNDKLIYDTGHQTYIHKMLTDRLATINTIRDTNGVCGLLNMDESPYDHYSPGHSGNALSVLSGMYSINKTQKNNKYYVAIIGDSAFNNGLSLEALSDIGFNHYPLIIIVNDNGMSISKSTGIFSKLFNEVKLNKSNFIKKINIKNIFKKLNFKYIGPIDGHNIVKIRNGLKKAKTLVNNSTPVIVHIKTIKGKGNLNIENDSVGYYHSSTLTKKLSFGEIAYQNLNQKIKYDKNIRILNPAMNIGSGFDQMWINKLIQYEDLGINEEHVIAKSGGMSLSNLNVYCLFYSTFLQRSYDQLLHDISRLNLNIKILLDRSDISGGDGDSHHGIFDVGYLKSIPNVEIMSPRNFDQLNQLIDYTYNYDSTKIQIIRYPKSPYINNLNIENKLSIQCFEQMIINKNSTILILTHGPYADVIYNHIKINKCNVDLICATWITNYKDSELQFICNKYKYIIVYERIYGDFGLYHDLCKYINENNLNIKLIPMNYKGFVGHGKNSDLDKINHLDIDAIDKNIKELVKNEQEN